MNNSDYNYEYLRVIKVTSIISKYIRYNPINYDKQYIIHNLDFLVNTTIYKNSDSVLVQFIDNIASYIGYNGKSDNPCTYKQLQTDLLTLAKLYEAKTKIFERMCDDDYIKLRVVLSPDVNKQTIKLIDLMKILIDRCDLHLYCYQTISAKKSKSNSLINNLSTKSESNSPFNLKEILLELDKYSAFIRDNFCSPIYNMYDEIRMIIKYFSGNDKPEIIGSSVFLSKKIVQISRIKLLCLNINNNLEAEINKP